MDKQQDLFIIKLVVMFSSRRASLSNADTGAGGTLFDFLKKKRILSRENSVSNTARAPADLSFSNIELKEDEQATQRVHRPSNLTEKKAMSSTITPKKVVFADSAQHKQTARTFVDMLSPLAGRTSIEAARQSTAGSKKSAKKDSAQQNYSRKELNNSVRIVNETLSRFIEVGKGLKEKSHSLFLQLKPVFRLAEQAEDKLLRKKVEQAKERLRVMEHQFAELDVPDAHQIIQKFQLRLSQHIISLQARNKASHDRSEMEYVARVKADKQQKVSQLSAQNAELRRSIQGLQKKVQKLTRELQKCQAQFQDKISLQQESKQSLISQLRQKIQSLEQTNSQAMQQLALLERENSQKEKKLKDALYAKEAMEAKLIEENANTKASREQFLLDQIMTLKEEFQADVRQLTALYASKEKDHLRIIEDQAQQINQLRALYEGNKQNDRRTSGEAESIRALAAKYRKQNQCLVTDMHRMNQQLYQHWLALKDIRTLACRLQLMPKFAKIYEDLQFNELMFS